ncbi:MAG: lipase secretion chaperone [Bermanella sp.]
MRTILIPLFCLLPFIIWWLLPSSSILENNEINVPITDGTTQAVKESSTSNASPLLQSIDWLNTSLKGTSIDGMYPVDSDGNLVLSDAIKHRFEYFLSTMGEFPLEQVLQMVKEDIAVNLKSPAKEQALKLFDDYVAYKYALVELEKNFESPTSYEVSDIERFRYQLEQLRNKRREYLDGAAVDAFFGFDELYDDFMLSQLDIQNNSQLTPQEKQQQLKDLHQTLPIELQEMREETQRVSTVFELTQGMKKNGANESEIFDYNSQEFGQAAAERLQKLDRGRDEWQEKVNGYLKRKASILSDELLSEMEKTEKVDNLKDVIFSAQEKKRLPAFEIMANESNGKSSD